MNSKYIKQELIVDVTNLPKEIRELVYDYARDRVSSNNSFLNFYVHDEQKPREEYTGNEILHVDKDNDYIVERGDDPISDFFYDEGCKNREELLIKIWW